MQAVMQNAAAAPTGRFASSPRRAAPAAAATAAAAAGRRRQQRRVAAAASVQLRDLEGGIHVLDVPEDTSILEAAIDKGVELPYDCKMGVCLQCAARIESGTVEQPGGMIGEDCMAQGYALLCVSYPKSDCVVQAIPEGDLVDAVMNIEA